MQDNAPVHIYSKVSEWFDEMVYNVMLWPPYSPDLNPIEHVWPILKQDFHRYYPELATMKGGPEPIKPLLSEALIHCWELLDPSIMENLARTMPNRIQAVLDAKGWYTLY